MRKDSFFVSILMLISSSALAQSEAPGEMKMSDDSLSVTSSLAPAAVAVQVSEPDEILERYHRATMNLAVGDVPEAKRALKQVIDAGGTHVLVEKAIEILEILKGPAGLAKLLKQQKDYDIPAAPKLKPSLAPDLKGKESSTRLARGELAFTQSIHGITLGVELCVLLECTDERSFIGSILLGTGAGLAGSFLYEPDGIRPGQAAAINSGTYWGAWTTLTMSIGFDFVRDAQTFTGLMMLGQLAGTAAGAFLYDSFEPTSGEVSMINSAGVWSGVLTALTLNVAEVNGQTDFWLPLFVITHAAGAGAAYLSRTYSMSRGRVLLIDGSGLLGGLLGASAVVLTAGSDASSEAVQTSMILGISGGLALGTYLSRSFDGPDINASVAVVPTEGGAMLTLGSVF